MSNFEFLNDKKAMTSNSYRIIYENAVKTEAAFRFSKALAAVYARLTLEQFCAFVAEYKKVKLSGKCTGVGYYWYPAANRIEMTQAVGGDDRLCLLQEINNVSKAYLHSFYNSAYKTEEYAQKMLEDMFQVLLWLYKELLNNDSSLTYNSFDWDKVKGDVSVFDVIPNVETSTEEEIDRFQEMYPNLKVKEACNVNKEDGYYVLTDINGKEIGRFYDEDEVLRLSQNGEQLRNEKNQLKKELDKLSSDYQQLEEAKDSEIIKLRTQVLTIKDQMGSRIGENAEITNALNQATAQLEKAKAERDKLKKGYESRIADLSRAYSKKLDEVEKLGSDYADAREQLQNLINDNNSLVKKHTKELDDLIKEKSVIQRKLDKAIDNIKNYSDQNAEAIDLINSLNRTIREKEKEINAQSDYIDQMKNSFSKEKDELIKKYKNKEISLETVLHNLEKENALYREEIENFRQNNSKKYLMLVNEEVNRVNSGFEVYAQSKSEKTLREMLTRVKEHYENEISQRDEQISNMAWDNSVKDQIIDELQAELDQRDNEERIRREEEQDREAFEEKLRQEEAQKREELEERLRRENEQRQNAFEEEVRKELRKQKKRRKNNKNKKILLPLIATLLPIVLALTLLVNNKNQDNTPEKSAQVNTTENADDMNSDEAFYLAETNEGEGALVNSDENNSYSDWDENPEEEIYSEIDPNGNNDLEWDSYSSLDEDFGADSNYGNDQMEENRPAKDIKGNGDDIINQMRDQIIEIPETFMDIPGLNPTLAEEIFIPISYMKNKDVYQYTYGSIYPDSRYSCIGKADTWAVDNTDAFFAWSDHNLTVDSQANVVKFFYYTCANLVFAVEPDQFAEGIDADTKFEDLISILGDNVRQFDDAQPTSFSTSETENMTMFCLKDHSKVLFGWDENGNMCDYIYFYPMVKMYLYKHSE